jgi:hypothetical protein
MRDTTLTRREALRYGGGLAGLLAASGLSGCSLLGGGGLPERSGTDVLDHAPSRSIAAAHVDAAALRSDDAALRAAVDSQLSFLHGQEERVPENTTAAMDLVGERTGLDPRGLEEVLAVVVRPPPSDDEEEDRSSRNLDPLAATHQAALVWSGWSTATVRSVLSAGAPGVEESQYRGSDVLTARRDEETLLTVAVREPGVFAVGQRAGVEALLDVAAGAAAATDTGLTRALAAARPGPARLAVAPRQSAERGSGFGDPVARLAGKVDVAYGSLYADGDRRGVELRLETGSGFDGEDVHETAQSVLALARSGQFLPTLQPVLRQVEATRSGATVTLRYEADVDAFATTLLSVAASFILPEVSGQA